MDKPNSCRRRWSVFQSIHQHDSKRIYQAADLIRNAANIIQTLLLSCKLTDYIKLLSFTTLVINDSHKKRKCSSKLLLFCTFFLFTCFSVRYNQKRLLMKPLNFKASDTFLFLTLYISSFISSNDIPFGKSFSACALSTINAASLFLLWYQTQLFHFQKILYLCTLLSHPSKTDFQSH